MIYMFLADGFEEIEALCPLDLLRRAEADVRTVGIGGNIITGAHGISFVSDLCENEIDPNGENIEMIILPGGMPGTINLKNSDTVDAAIDSAVSRDVYIAAICAAPSILGEKGILDGKEAICYPGFEDKLIGARISKSRVVLDGKIVTAAGMGVALEFGLLLVSLLFGQEKADKLRKSVIAD